MKPSTGQHGQPRLPRVQKQGEPAEASEIASERAGTAGTERCATLLLGLGPLREAHPGPWTQDLHAPACTFVEVERTHPQTVTAAPQLLKAGTRMRQPGRLLTWMATRGDWEKYQSGTPNRLMSAVLVSYVSEQRVLKTLPPVAERRRDSASHPTVSEAASLSP